ncbi:hypothetical protein RQP46_003789 [Phenoliferia psychrophenolica]
MDTTSSSIQDEKNETGSQEKHVHRTEEEIEADNGGAILEARGQSGRSWGADLLPTAYDHAEVKLFVDGVSDKGLKLARDGRTILIPQPSDDPRDPLNWSDLKKTTILLILAFAAFGGDFQSGAGIPLLEPQGLEWGMTPPEVNVAGNLNVAFLGIGGLLWIPPLYFWGRLPVLFWTQLLGTLFVLGSCLVTSFEQYYALRPLTSLFLTAGQTIGLTFIRDMYCFHDHARKIGVWVFIFLCSPYCGPFFGGFMVNGLGGQWRPVLWLVFAYSSTVLLAIVFFAEETWYDRTLAQQPDRTSGLFGRIKDLVGITGFEHRALKPNVFPSVMRLFEIFAKPVTWMVFFICGYGFSLRTISFLYFTPLVGLAIGEVIGHYANDWVATRYIRRHKGIFRPECRLYTYFGAAPLMIGGLVLVGQALQRQLNVGAVVVGWGAYVIGVMISSVAVTSYLLDAFPSASGEVSAVVNLARTISGFSVGYFQLEWGLTATFGVSFGRIGPTFPSRATFQRPHNQDQHTMPYELPSLLFTIPRNPAVAVGLPIALGFASGFITRSSVKTWYRPLIKPPGEPPALAFPIAWTLLYASMGFASHLLVSAHDAQLPGTQLKSTAKLALQLYWAQYGLNLLWTPLFFGAQQVLAALVDISILTPTTFALTYYAHKVDPRTTYLLGPYCAWLSYATYLNAGVYYLNYYRNRVKDEKKAL